MASKAPTYTQDMLDAAENHVNRRRAVGSV